MIEEMYVSDEYLKKNPSWHVEDSPQKAKNILKIINQNKLKPKTVCEIGCGAGEILNQLYYKMPDYVEFTGYEISPNAYNLCQKREKERLKFHLKNFFEENELFFDIILIIDVIEHVENCYEFLRKIRTKGEYKIFNMPLELWTKCLFPNQLLYSRKNVGHLHYWNKELALSLLKETGYQIIDYTLTPPIEFTQTRINIPKLLAIPRRILYTINKDFAARTLGGSSLIVLAK